MSELKVHAATAYIPVSLDDLADAESFGVALADVLEGRVQPGAFPSAPRPTAYDRLLAATNELVREIVEMHGPQAYRVGDRVVSWQCRGCDYTGYEAEPVDWPCETSGLIASRVGVSLEA